MRGAVAGMALVLTACASGNDRATFPDLSFENLETVALGASSVTLTFASAPSRQPPHVEHMSPVSFCDVVSAWSNRRFAANGVGNTRVVVTLELGTITERALDVDDGVRGMLKREQATEYEARVKVAVRALGPDGQQRAEAVAEAWQRRTLGENATLADRQTLLFEMVEATVMAMDAQLMPEMRQRFADYVL